MKAGAFNIRCDSITRGDYVSTKWGFDGHCVKAENSSAECLQGVIRVVSAMSAVSPLYPHEPTSSVRPTKTEKCHYPTYGAQQSYSITSSATTFVG
jgi:hypothetical protein